MIFITVGTQDKQFMRLLEEVESLKSRNIIKDDIIAQIGCNKFKSKSMKTHKTIPSKDFNKLLIKSDLVITHGGVGSILDALKHNKKVIAVPRLKEYKEHVNNHQVQIVSKMNEDGFIIGINDPKELEEAIKKAKTFKPKPYFKNNRLMIKTIKDFISNS